MPKINDFPQFFEELKNKEEATFTLSDLITQLKQRIPVNFVYLEIKEKNYQCSTTGWKEPVCERYGFEYQGDWKQIDIPHSLLAKLNLKKGEDLPSAFYLAPHLLKKETETSQGGITLQEGEIILLDPNKITLKDQEIQTDLSSAKVKELEETIAKQFEQLQSKDKELADLKAEKQALETKYGNFLDQIKEKMTKYWSTDSVKDETIILESLRYTFEWLTKWQKELAEERGWWDKWIEHKEFSDIYWTISFIYPESLCFHVRANTEKEAIKSIKGSVKAIHDRFLSK